MKHTMQSLKWASGVFAVLMSFGTVFAQSETSATLKSTPLTAATDLAAAVEIKVVTVTATKELEPAKELPELDLEALAKLKLVDQFGDEHNLAFPKPRPLFLTLNGKNGGDQIASWIVPIVEKSDELTDFMSVAELKLVPRLFRGMVKKKFANDCIAPVILDWTGAVAGLIPFDPDNLTVLVINPQGKVLFLQTGYPTEDQLAEANAAILEASALTTEPKPKAPKAEQPTETVQVAN